MKITGPLVLDLSYCDNHINADELVAGGVVSIIMGLYKRWDGSKYVLNTNCERICNQIKASKLILQTYCYYYPQRDPIAEANWYVDTMFQYGLPVTYAWADIEDHSAVMDAKLRSEQYRRFTAQVYSRFPKVGIYTRKSFVDEYAPEMNKWMGKYPTWISHWAKSAGHILMSWEQFKATELPNFNILVPTGATNVVGHQFTGDLYHLPGIYDSGMTMNGVLYKNRMRTDVSVFTPEFIKSIGGEVVSPPIPPPVNPTAYKIVPAAVNIRSAPIATASTWVRYAYHDEVVYVLGNPTNGYIQLIDKTWVWQTYLIKA
jgi:GH25 family lysozyme M1 (1,4-beta-N-acetylmuramidase)